MMIKLALMLSVLAIGKMNTGTQVEIYPTTAIVVETNTEEDTVTCEDFNGNLWTFSEVEDWMVGDIVSMTMSNNGTEEIYDDVILRTRYSGWIK